MKSEKKRYKLSEEAYFRIPTIPQTKWPLEKLTRLLPCARITIDSRRIMTQTPIFNFRSDFFDYHLSYYNEYSSNCCDSNNYREIFCILYEFIAIRNTSGHYRDFLADHVALRVQRRERCFIYSVYIFCVYVSGLINRYWIVIFKKGINKH